MKKKSKVSTIISVFAFIIGLTLLLYPTVANYWNSKHATKTINTYSKELENITDTETQKMWQDAVQYNEKMKNSETSFYLNEQQREEYESLLNVGGTGIMGYIEIGKINIMLPIYHGTSEGILQVAIGHIDWSSLPVGGDGSHCVLSGHRGLPSAKLFTDIDKLIEGDTFKMVILDTTLTYEVDQIRTVLPNEVQNLTITEGKDYCTLVTCTPYGINTHRLLVRGHRVGNAASESRIVADAVVIDPMIVAPIIATPLILIFIIRVLTKKPESKKKNKRKEEKINEKN